MNDQIIILIEPHDISKMVSDAMMAMLTERHIKFQIVDIKTTPSTSCEIFEDMKPIFSDDELKDMCPKEVFVEKRPKKNWQKKNY